MPELPVPRPREGVLPLTPPQPVGATTTFVWEPPSRSTAACAVVLAHGAGTDARHPLLQGIAGRIAGGGFPTLSFNFPYREAGRRAPDPLPRLRSAYADAVRLASSLFELPLVIGGRSMGGRVASLLAADGTPARGLALLSYPLHPAGRREQLRTEHWPRLRLPVLFVSGTRDAMFDLDRFAQARPALAGPVQLHLVEGGDHGYAVRRSARREPADVLADVADACLDWLRGLGR